MKLFVNVLMSASALAAAFFLGNMAYGAATDISSMGMSLLLFQFMGAIASAATLALGGVSWAMGRQTEPAETRYGKFGVFLGAVGLAALSWMLFFWK